MSQFFYFVFCLLCRLDIGIHRITDQSLRISLYILSVPSHITVYLTSPSAYHCISYQSLRTSLYLISPYAHHYILSVPPHITVYLISPSAYHCISYHSLRISLYILPVPPHITISYQSLRISLYILSVPPHITIYLISPSAAFQQSMCILKVMPKWERTQVLEWIMRQSTTNSPLPLALG